MAKKKNLIAMTLVLQMMLILLFAAGLPITAQAASDAVAEMSIFSYTANAFDTGHAWLYFENISDEDITVGKYVLSPGEGVSIGTFKYSRSDGAGIYYNVEAYCTARYGSSGRVSRTQTITEAQLAAVNTKILNNNNWTLSRNCVYFAELVWNTVSGQKIETPSLPLSAKIAIKRGTYATNKAMNVPAAGKVFKQKGSGAEAYLVPVSQGTLNNAL